MCEGTKIYYSCGHEKDFQIRKHCPFAIHSSILQSYSDFPYELQRDCKLQRKESLKEQIDEPCHNCHAPKKAEVERARGGKGEDVTGEVIEKIRGGH